MIQASYDDRHFHSAFHIDINEAEILLNYHTKAKTKVKSKLEKLFDKACDGSAKYDFQIQETRQILEFHHTSIINAEKLIEFYKIRQKQLQPC
jgi:hypothetical protein